MSDRYFVESPVASDRAVLAGAEAHHLLHVMRGKVGTRVTLFDGSGWQFDAVVQRTSRSEVELAIAGRQEINREAQTTVTLGVALPKGDRQKWLVEKLVELGVARLVPLETERGVAQPVENALERLRRGVIEASKQCGRNRLMEIAEPKAWQEFLVENEAVGCRWIAHPMDKPSGGTRFTRPTLLSCGTGVSPAYAAGTAAPQKSGVPMGQVSSESAALAVGPEGGFTDQEVSLAIAQGWQPVDLGPRILRVETAAIALAARVIG